MDKNKVTKTNQNEITCKNCAAKLKFKPGTTSLSCEYCGTKNEILIDKSKIREATREIDYQAFIQNTIDVSAQQEVTTVKCSGCGAETNFDPNIVSSKCDFCGSPMVANQGESHNAITPSALIPFKIEAKQGKRMFQVWLTKLWWAPNKLKQYARTGRLTGMYIPYWTYDSNTTSQYSGQRGDEYQVEEEYTNSEGESESRTVTKVDWTSVSGTVYNMFDDILIVGSKSLPVKLQDKLEPWNLNELIPYDNNFLSGFRTETYQVDVKDAWTGAQQKMEPTIEKTIKSDIGGDRQRISSKNVYYDNTTFKHILLPLWISAYRYNDKVYRFLINGQTGEVQGERPYSWIKIALAVIVAIIVLIILLVIFAAMGG